MGRTFQKNIAEYIMPLYPPFWSPFKQNGGHFRSNTSIPETKRRRAFNFDAMSRFFGSLISEIVLPNTSCHCIHHYNGRVGTYWEKIARLSALLGRWAASKQHPTRGRSSLPYLSQHHVSIQLTPEPPAFNSQNRVC